MIEKLYPMVTPVRYNDQSSVVHSYPTRVHEQPIFGPLGANVSHVFAKLIKFLDSAVDEVGDVDVIF